MGDELLGFSAFVALLLLLLLLLLWNGSWAFLGLSGFGVGGPGAEGDFGGDAWSEAGHEAAVAVE
ncbi:hypothetical protein, partial [Streptomyces sp. NPDC058254]|uniref:hypothetical protein n=1 Tax=Streptomyces sp. NPDC058254 TaxID=3346406 RepID=UPI0036EC472A